MTLFIRTLLITDFTCMALLIIVNKIVFDGFMVMVLGSFGIASVDKWINKKKDNKTEE